MKTITENKVILNEQGEIEDIIPKELFKKAMNKEFNLVKNLMEIPKDKEERLAVETVRRKEIVEIYNEEVRDLFLSTYLMAREGRHYIHTHEEYFVNMQSFNSLSSYSASLPAPLETTWNYLQNRFGTVRNNNIIEVFFKKLRNFCCRHFRINFK